MEPAKLLTDLPDELVEHIVVRIALIHHIGRAAPTCRVVSVAARNACKMRDFSRYVDPDAQRRFLMRGAPRAERLQPADVVVARNDDDVKVRCRILLGLMRLCAAWHTTHHS